MYEVGFDIFALDRASRVFERVGTQAEVMGKRGVTAGAMLSKGMLVAGAVALGLGVKAVHMAGDFDSAVTRLTTTAGESPKALGTVSKGLLDMAGKVGYTAQELAVGMYTVESAGFHGAAGLKVMEAAAKGARVEGADLTTTTDAVSSLLVDYHLHASDAARVTNVLTAAVGHGKTTFQGMAAALPNVAAAGATAHITMEELASAIATMTMHGTDAAKAGTYLRQVIGQLEGPSAKARMVMKGLGIDANKLGLTLSSGSGHGLADAIGMVDDAITKHLQPSGLVAIQTFAKSKGSVSDYQKMLANLPPAYTTTFGALSQMVGGVKSLQGFLQLGGENLKTYKANVAAVREQVRKGGSDVEGYAIQQATLNGKWNDAKGAVSALMVELGQKLEPTAISLANVVLRLTGFLTQHQHAVLLVGEALVAGATALTIFKIAMIGANAVMRANPIGLVISLLTALAVALIYAYNHSRTFRNIVNNAWDTVKLGAEEMALGIVTYFHFMMNAWLTVVSGIVIGAAKAFGWVPGLGPKLKSAAAKIVGFKDDANSAISRIQNSLEMTVKTQKARNALNDLRRAASAPITVPVFLQTHYTAGSVNVAGVGRVNAGMRAGGGPVQAHQPYVVGEKHAELFVPDESGYIIPDVPGASPHGPAYGGATTIVQLVLDGKVVQEWVVNNGRAVQQGLLKLKRGNGGAALGLN